jgi:hypothetical protein
MRMHLKLHYVGSYRHVMRMLLCVLCVVVCFEGVCCVWLYVLRVCVLCVVVCFEGVCVVCGCMF